MTTADFDLGDAERERRLLLRIIDLISSGQELGPLVNSVAALITDATATDVCFVHLLDDSGRMLTLTGATPPFDQLAGRIQLAVGEGVSGWVAQHGEPVVIPEDKLADPRYWYIPELHGEQYVSMASVPMRSGPDVLVGVLNVHTSVRREFTPLDLHLLSSIGSLVAGAISSARLHRRLAEREHALQRFAERTVALQERERRRLAAEIHDGISQRIVGLAFHLSAAADAVTTDATFTAAQIGAARALAVAALDETRVAIAGLRPPVLDDLGLAASLESLARSIPDVDVEVDVEVNAAGLPEHVETALYRITQEALQNIAKHAAAAHARVELRADQDRVRLRVRDDGRGFATDPDGSNQPVRSLRHSAGRTTYGLASMTERADLIGARLHVASTPGQGTTVTVTLPP
ncbi:MAG: GAF domain-containing sensor histidine kinase [Egibacteraceae bacterium]